MLDSFHIAATGMHAEQAQIDTVANNLVNMNTVGFKKARVAFQTLMPAPLAGAARADALRPPSFRGMGVAGADALVDFANGSLKQTLGELDFAIQGSGLFEVELPDGSYAYTRNGAFHIDNDRYLVNADGYPLSARIEIPSDAEQVVVAANGRVQIKSPGSDQLIELGYLQLSQFANPAALQPIGNNLYRANDASGEPLYSDPGDNGTGLVSQGYLEASNVQMIEELTSMMAAQRAYEAGAKVLRASDELLGIINNLRQS